MSYYEQKQRRGDLDLRVHLDPVATAPNTDRITWDAADVTVKNSFAMGSILLHTALL